jgi:uroporphyrin-III C-methyltransferase
VSAGKVILVGAGPGDPELLTLKALRCLQTAEVVAYDELCSDAVLELVPAGVELLRVGRRADDSRFYQGPVHSLVAERALAGKRVVRLKGGDPMVFGRAGEEIAILRALGVTVEVVPGVSAALAAAASAQLPHTHRGVARSVTFVTAHALDGAVPDLAGLPEGGTLCLYMGARRIAEVVATLTAAGWPADLPAAVVACASLPGEQSVFAPLAELAARAEGLPTPAIIFVGAAVAHAAGARELLAAAAGQGGDQLLEA